MDTDPSLQPVDHYVFTGLERKIAQQFRCPAIFVTSPDQTRQLNLVQGKQLEYPYIFMTVQTWSAASDRYTANRLARQGLPVAINTGGNQFSTVRVIPANFEIEVTFTTNKSSVSDASLTGVSGFTRRWLFLRRNGALNFVVNYGMTDFPITCKLSESVTTPKRDSPTEQESVYQVTTTLTLEGFTSEPVTGRRGRIQDIVLSEEVPPIPTGATYFPF